MHDIPIALLELQAESNGIPLHIVGLTPKGNMIDYANAMKDAVAHFKQLEITHFIFGDVFLHDVRKYREQQLTPYGITVVKPMG